MTTLHSALVPVPKLENDFYDWYHRHEEILRIQAEVDPEIVLVGDSITHLWGGPPQTIMPGGRAGVSQEAWREVFGELRVLNLGFGWDRTQNVLWRLQNGQLAGLRPRLVSLLIGTNNLTGTENAPENTPEEIADGILAVHAVIRQICPEARIVVMGVLPRGPEPGTPMRHSIATINALLAPALADASGTQFLDIGSQFLAPDGTLPVELFPDGTHLSEAGYRIWGRALRKAAIEPLFGAEAL